MFTIPLRRSEFANPRAHRRVQFKAVQAVLFVAAVALGGCSSSPFSFAPNFSWAHKVDIQQGTVVTKDMAEKLQTGMTREQVRFILGTPLIADVFHANRWDYPYRFQPGRGEIQERKFTVFFENDRLARFDSDPLPTEEEFRKGQKGELPPLPDAPGKSWWERVKGIFGS